MSLRWLRALLDHGITVRGQIVVCPGVNDGAVLDDTLAGVLDQYPELDSVAVVPLGISKFNPEAAMRLHTVAEAQAVVDIVEDWQDVFQATLGRRMVFAADEYYLMAERPFPSRRALRGLPDARGRHRHGPHVRSRVHTARATTATGVQRGFFACGRRAAEPGGATPACARPDAARRAVGAR